MTELSAPAPGPSMAPPNDELPPSWVEIRELLVAEGWTVSSVWEARGRLLFEAHHPVGGAVMATRSAKRSHLYALSAKGRNWFSVSRSGLDTFIGTHSLAKGTYGPVRESACNCNKKIYPTRARAQTALLDLKIQRIVIRGGLEGERRAYRCPDDDRQWHLTSRSHWHPR